MPRTSLADQGSRMNYGARLIHSGTPAPWTPASLVGVGALCLLWAWQLYASWAAWGDLTVDSGHEMYVPAVLAEGQTLYRDVWFMYGPVSAYANSYLFRALGTHLDVLYWAGSLSALASALLLVVIGRRLSVWHFGWTAGIVLVLQAFERSLFCFPLPYSFAAVYGCLLGMIFVWSAVRAVQSPRVGWVYLAALLASVAALTKPEFGLAACAGLGATILLRRGSQLRASLLDDCAAVLPGFVLCAIVTWWMVSLEGAAFITQENMVSWPTSHFMKTYGAFWLEHTGFALTWSTLRVVLLRAVLPACVVLGLYTWFNWKRTDGVALFARVGLLSVGLAFAAAGTGFKPATVVRALAFPPDMVFYVILAGATGWWALATEPERRRHPAVLVVVSFTSALAFRIMFKMSPAGYSIYYNGPVILCFLLVVRAMLQGLRLPRGAVRISEAALCLGCILAVIPWVGHIVPVRDLEALATPRGTVRVPHDLAVNYRTAIAFMRQQAAAGRHVSSIPEDTSLYFLSETHSPTRMYSFTPGVIAPGKMTQDTIREFEAKRVHYLVWSNRTFPEFGTPVFGLDYNRELGDYLRMHYRRSFRLTRRPGWTADVWERIPERRAAPARLR